MRWNALTATAFAFCSLAGSARAGEGVLDVTSDVRFKEGVAALDAGKCEQSRVSFMQALSLEPGNADVLLNLAIAEHCTKHYVESLGHLKEYLASPKANPKAIPELKEVMYKELWQLTGHLKVFADGGADIVLDGNARGKAPLHVDVMPGKHHLVAGERTLDVTVAAGETKDVNLASPVVEAPKEAKGSYWTERHITGVALGGLAVVAAGLGIGFWAAHQSHVSEGKDVLSNPNACGDPTSNACRQFGDARSSAKTTAVISGVSFAAAGALAVGAVVLLWPKHTKEGVRMIPAGQGILIDGAF